MHLQMYRDPEAQSLTRDFLNFDMPKEKKGEYFFCQCRLTRKIVFPVGLIFFKI